MLETCPAVVILTDLLGGTPFRISMTVASNYPNVEVLAGTNLPMVLEGLALRTISTNVEDFVSMVTDSARDGIVHKKLEQPQANT
ncbi:PTS sugar transporter subunit IIA, partial [Enterococcus gallinarum]